MLEAGEVQDVQVKTKSEGQFEVDTVGREWAASGG